jgi:hypothetical protein
MAPVASFDRSRWVIDGGVLVNTPFRPALDAVATLPAQRPVRRVLAYVVPHLDPPSAADDDRATPPSSLDVGMSAASRIPRVQTLGRELEEIAANNKAVAKRRRSRTCTLDDLSPQQLETVAQALLETYLCVRREAAVADIIDLVLRGRTQEMEERRRKGDEAPGEPAIEQVEALRRSLRALRDEPWLPPREDPFAMTPGTWRWGIAPIENAGNLTLDLLRRAIDAPGAQQDAIESLRGELHVALRELRLAARHNREFWARCHWLLERPGAVAEVARDWTPAADAEGIARRLAAILRATERIMTREGSGALAGEMQTLTDATPAEVEPDVEVTLRRLVQLDVVQRSSGANLVGTEQAIELVLVSADTPNAFDDRAAATAKLAGLQVAHFGSFYKRSWRANDWLWGRLDGAERAARALLDPRRIRRRLDAGTPAEALRDEIRSIAVPEPGPPLDDAARRRLADAWDGAGVLGELTALAGLDVAPAPAALPLAHAAIVRRLQLEILLEELPGVMAAARADVAAGAATDATGAVWERTWRDTPLDGQNVVAAFAGCRIGTETVAGEAASDHFTAVATRTLGVGGSVAGGALRWRPLRPIMSTLRGVLLALYLLGRGVVAGSRTGNFLVALALAAAGALIGLSLLGADVPGLLTLLGAVLLLAAILLGALRRTWRRIVAVAVLYAAIVVAYHLVEAWGGRPEWVDAVAVTAALALLAASATLLGYWNAAPAEAD